MLHLHYLNVHSNRIPYLDCGGCESTSGVEFEVACAAVGYPISDLAGVYIIAGWISGKSNSGRILVTVSKLVFVSNGEVTTVGRTGGCAAGAGAIQLAEDGTVAAATAWVLDFTRIAFQWTLKVNLHLHVTCFPPGQKCNAQNY